MFFTRRAHHQIATDNRSNKFVLFSWLFSCCMGHADIDDCWEDYNTQQTPYYNCSINDSGMALSGGDDNMWFS